MDKSCSQLPSAPEVDGAELCETDSEKVLECLSKILRSRQFRKEPILQRLMDYLARAALNGRAHALNERAIGIEVLELGSDFDPHANPIVAIHAKKLWERLENYYRDEGMDDAVRIDLDFVYSTCRWGGGQRRRAGRLKKSAALQNGE